MTVVRGGNGKEKGRLALAWISFGLAVVGGAAISGTFFGGIVSGFVGFFWAWVGIVLFVGSLIALAIDLFIDGEPNQVALYTAILLPSLARAVPGQLSNTITNASTQALSQLNAQLGVWLGTSSLIGIALACIVASLLMGRRVLAKTPGR